MPNLDHGFLETAGRRLEELGLDGWLLYDFRAKNPIAANLLGLPEGQKRRFFVLLRPARTPVASANHMMRRKSGSASLSKATTASFDGGVIFLEPSSRRPITRTPATGLSSQSRESCQGSQRPFDFR